MRLLHNLDLAITDQVAQIADLAALIAGAPFWMAAAGSTTYVRPSVSMSCSSTRMRKAVASKGKPD